MSLDGFLARPDDAFDFLHGGEQVPHGFDEFLASVDVVVIGRRTFDVVLNLGYLELYGKKPMVVLSSRPLDFSSVKGGLVEHRPIGDHTRASADRSGHPVIWPPVARH